MDNQRYERLDQADVWLTDAVDLTIIPSGHVSRLADMSRPVAALERVRAAGGRVSYAALFARAAALALVRLPELHQMIVGRRRYQYDRADICLSVAGSGAVAPTMILRDAANRSLSSLSEEIADGAGKAQLGQGTEMNALRRWGWLIPFRAWRRALLRALGRSPAFRASRIGTFQVTILRGVDQVVPLQFGTAGILAAGEVQPRVLAVNGVPVVRPTAILTCAFNHKVWDGMAGQRFLSEVVKIVETSEVVDE
jgi:2-oxoisovalerate dehydrogenase E2 component (dihydrolipoyl transacylase)